MTLFKCFWMEIFLNRFSRRVWKEQKKVKLQPHSPFWLSSFISVATLSLRVTTLQNDVSYFPEQHMLEVSANNCCTSALNRSPNWKETHFSTNLSNFKGGELKIKTGQLQNIRILKNPQVFQIENSNKTLPLLISTFTPLN